MVLAQDEIHCLVWFWFLFSPCSLSFPLAEMRLLEGKQGSLQATLQEEVIALKKEVATLRGEVASLERSLEDTEKRRRDVVVRLADGPRAVGYVMSIQRKTEQSTFNTALLGTALPWLQ